MPSIIALVREVEQACVICKAPVLLRTSTTPHPESPEVMQLPEGAWIAFYEDCGTWTRILCCSDDCRKLLLFE